MSEEGPIGILLTEKKRQLATGERNLETDVWFALRDLDGLKLEELIAHDSVDIVFAETQMAKGTSSHSYPDLDSRIEKLNRENQDMSFSLVVEEGAGGPICTGVRIDRIRDGSHVDGRDGPLDTLLRKKHKQIDEERSDFQSAMSFALLNFAGCHLTSLAKYGRTDVMFGQLGYSEYAARRLRPLLPAYVEYMNRMDQSLLFSIVEGQTGGLSNIAIRIVAKK